MAKLGIIGDSHGNELFLTNTLDRLAEKGVDVAILLGDFGIFPAFRDTLGFLDGVNQKCREVGIKLIAVRGNHDSTDFWNWHLKNMPVHHRNAYIRTNILITPDLNDWRFDGKRMFAVNGAVSIDAPSRRRQEQRASGPRTLWWPDEAITDDMVRSVQRIDMRRFEVDYLFSHECSNKTRWKNRLKPDFESEQNRLRMDKILNHLRPALHFHGHMHEKYEWENLVVNDEGVPHYIREYGLECDGMWNSWGVLDTTTDTFLWRGEPRFDN